MSQFQFIGEDEWNTWIPVATALGRVGNAIGELAAARDEIFERLCAGRLDAAAKDTDWYQGPKVEKRQYEHIFPSVWKLTQQPDYDDRFWMLGTLGFALPDETTGRRERTDAYGIRFEPIGLNAILSDAGVLPSKLVVESPSPVTGARRGAKRKDWWDHLWIEMIRRIESDSLNPAGPAELQRTMLDWLGDQQIFPGEDTIKRSASNLFKYLKERRGN